eukprot:CAMPEP_0198731684 /NCGR_PEP_ID=MMETSP1475-20131203/31421_1 /TAXON_ID= ORGANISM="Unidentified sp., Strain CCMP1999" /NCGR_SAMPLE_ID=MMETSP1475 /ASSEMBLY_ACC=CAM_ASM_001111 /LENGTH=31 /DNA_ID= /DNA_START= /DNA_END= /DNA_ORIENTATION=
MAPRRGGALPGGGGEPSKTRTQGERFYASEK